MNYKILSFSSNVVMKKLVEWQNKLEKRRLHLAPKPQVGQRGYSCIKDRILRCVW
jgi:hypothetical protein